MLKRKYRLNAKIRLKPTISFSTRLFLFKAAKNNLSYNRYSFVVSKSVDKRAVIRNKIKREFRARIEKIIGRLAVGYDMLFIIRKEALEAKNLCSTIEMVLHGEGFLK